MCGLSVFRDHMRVLPYGEPGNDWLFLDQERINDPTERIANNQVIGLVQVDQAQNLLLRDKTNREGLIENDSFLDLRALVRAAFRHFTSYWRTDRPRKEARPAPQRGTIEDARTVAVALRQSARPDIPVVLPATPGLETGSAAQPDAESTGHGRENGTLQPGGPAAPADTQPVDGDESREVITQQQAVDRIIQSLNGAE